MGGFNISSVKAHLSKTWGPDSQRADTVLLIAATMEPAKGLGSKAKGKARLDTAVQVYAQRVGISLSTGGSGSAGGSYGEAVMNSEEFLKLQVRSARCIAITNRADADLIKFGQVPAQDQRGAEEPYQSSLLRHGPFVAQDSQQPPAACVPCSRRSLSQFLRLQISSITSVSAVQLLHAGLQCCGFLVLDGVFALQDTSAISKRKAILHRHRAHTSVE